MLQECFIFTECGLIHYLPSVNLDSQGSQWNPRCFLKCQELFKIWLRSPIFWDIKLCSPLKVNRNFGGALLSTYFMFMSCLAFSLKTETTYSSETLLTFNRMHGVTSQKFFHNRCCDTLKSYIKNSPPPPKFWHFINSSRFDIDTFEKCGCCQRKIL
jgi:hypothetical protein